MDDATMRERLHTARVGHLATVRANGHPHVVACCFVLDGETLYSAVDAKPKWTVALQRLDNIAANPWVSLLADHYEDDWAALWWVRVDGTARIITSGPEFERALLDLTAKYQQYAHQPPPGPVIAIDAMAWRGWP